MWACIISLDAINMSRTRLPGVSNTLLRRRILRNERQIIPEALRTLPHQTGNCDSVREARAGEDATPMGALLSLPPDHPSGALLSSSWTVPASQALPDGNSWYNDLGSGSSSPLRAPPPEASSAETWTATPPQAGLKRSSTSMDTPSPSWELHAIFSKRGRHDLPAYPDLVADRQSPRLRRDSVLSQASHAPTVVKSLPPCCQSGCFMSRAPGKGEETMEPYLSVPWLQMQASSCPTASRHGLHHIYVDDSSLSQGPTDDFLQPSVYPASVHHTSTSVAPSELLFTDFAQRMTSAEVRNTSPMDSSRVTSAENSFARTASISRDFGRVASVEDRAFARLLSGGVDFECLMSDAGIRFQPSPYPVISAISSMTSETT
jgi:hypothetical protein